MSARRGLNNRIRGPQSALTDYLASNNISAQQIRDDFERRRQAALQQEQQENEGAEVPHENDDEAEEEEKEVETEIQTKKRKRQEDKAIAKIKQSKEFQRRKVHSEGDPEGNEDDITFNMYEKKKPLPGQLENCEKCEKRFTVTAYSKTGPDGGLLCTKCSKEQEDQRKKDMKPKPKAVNRAKQRQARSNLLDGIVRNGSKTLQELCVEKIADNINDVEEFGDLPPALLDRLSQILSRRRVITSRTQDLFLRPDVDTVAIYDCGKLDTADFVKIFSVIPKIKTLNLRQAGQMKDEVIDYLLERDIFLKNLQLDAANLISDEKWREFFSKRGEMLESLKLSWLDFSMNDETVEYLVAGCPNLKRLKLKKCFKVGDASLDAMSRLQNLEHLSIRFNLPTTAPPIINLIKRLGPKLSTLSLEQFDSADDEVLETIRNSCAKLSKLRFTENDYCTDAGYTALFTNWTNPPLKFIDLSSNRDIDCTNPDGPEDPVGLTSTGFKALMLHSGSKLESLDVSSCRHISHAALYEVFNGVKQYPELREINFSLLPHVDTAIVAGIFKSCPNIKKVVVFACFGVRDVVVPLGVALIGIPSAQDSIIQEGGGIPVFDYRS